MSFSPRVRARSAQRILVSSAAALFLLTDIGLAQPIPQRPTPSVPSQPPVQRSKEQALPEKPPAAPSTASTDPRDAPAAVDVKSYLIGPEDILFVSVWREPDITRQVVVRPDGKITMNLIGELQAGGLTPDRLGKQITEALQKFINTPDVNVSVLQVNSKKYYVNGEVNRPGPFPMPVPVNVLQAISNAGGFKDFANKKKIVILRGSKRIFFNYNEVIKGKKMEQNIFLEPGDQIFVN